MLTAKPDIDNGFKIQKESFLNEDASSLKDRINDLNVIKKALLKYQHQLSSAMNEDFGNRNHMESLFGDILPLINTINYQIKKLPFWMRPSRRKPGLLLSPAKVEIHYQPLGVIGIIVPWNFPVQLSIHPLITALSSGNRAMIKLSEFTPKTNTILQKLIDECFDKEKVMLVHGDSETAEYFTTLPFDHILFTGSTSIGKKVMKAAAENLTPVTLELGGKSPVIICDDIKIETAVERLILGKCLNAGQMCVSPDYIFCPNDQVDNFITTYKNKFKKMFGEVNNNNDYSSIINDKQFTRLINLIEDAKNKGAKIISCSDENFDLENRKMSTQLLTDVTDDMLVMQEEIFGPILTIMPYSDLNDVISYINDRPKPLALYIMSFNKKVQDFLIKKTQSGGICINETAWHVAIDDAPFGGIGASGMGQYHGKEGFLTFSKAKTVMTKGKFGSGKFIHPPYNNFLHKLLMKLYL